MTKKEKEEILEELKKELFKSVEVMVEVCREGIALPNYANIGDAGMDVRSALDISINPGETVIVPTGLKMIIPEHYEVQIRPRSGYSLKTPLRIANSPATIDSGYRGEIGVIMWNTSNNVYNIEKGSRIAQLVLMKHEVMKLSLLEEGQILKYSTTRGSHGYGSTGVN